MGGLKNHMRTTHWTFLIGTIAIAGVFPFAGFFSKDQILAAAWEHNKVMFALGMFVSACTAFYMFRLYYLTFHGKFRGTHEQEHHLHESPSTMTIPLVVLAVLSMVGGFIGLPHAVGEHFGMHWHWLDMQLHDTLVMENSHMHLGTEIMLMLAATVVALGSIYYAFSIYKKRGVLAMEDKDIKGGLHRLLHRKYGFDELYDSLIRKPVDAISGFVARVVEPLALDGAVNGSGTLTQWMGKQIRLMQNGSLAFYLLTFIIGLILLLIYL
jgi:NADH-quinone oxidoreductase subunit L